MHPFLDGDRNYRSGSNYLLLHVHVSECLRYGVRKIVSPGRIPSLAPVTHHYLLGGPRFPRRNCSSRYHHRKYGWGYGLQSLHSIK